MDTNIFRGGVPAIMTPCLEDRIPNYPALVAKAHDLVATGMNAVVYCGSMGDWPLLSDEQRREGVRQLTEAGVPVIVGTGAQNTARAAAHAAHAQEVGAGGLMVIPRLLSRGTSPAAQRNHFAAILAAAPELPAVIYNSPYYGFETKAELFFELRSEHPNLVGFKEFGGAEALTYAAEHITSIDDNVLLMVGVDTQVYHGYINCGAVGAITGIGNCLPAEVLHLLALCALGAAGDEEARTYAAELDSSLEVLSTYDEGPDLVLYYKYILHLLGESDFELNFNEGDSLDDGQKQGAESELKRFQAWWGSWPGKSYGKS
ncbi:MAG: dihydrodipicolinate synthase family protein [Planctomycetes bacterium]|nr:dihydrodipicolinate synthase family protein [Planctomycetota bacterium]